MAVTCQLPIDMGGAEGKCLYIDTEGTFRYTSVSFSTIDGLTRTNIVWNFFAGVPKVPDWIELSFIALVSHFILFSIEYPHCPASDTNTEIGIIISFFQAGATFSSRREIRPFRKRRPRQRGLCQGLQHRPPDTAFDPGFLTGTITSHVWNGKKSKGNQILTERQSKFSAIEIRRNISHLNCETIEEKKIGRWSNLLLD